MHRIEGYLAKNMARILYSSSYAVQVQIRTVFMTVSRIDLVDGVSEVEFYCSPSKSSRSDITGVAVASGILAGKGKHRGELALAAMLGGIISEGVERKHLAKDLRHAVFLSQVTAKFMITGEYYPSTTFETLIRDNIKLHLIAPDQITKKRFKLIKKANLKKNSRPELIVAEAQMSLSKEATHLVLGRDGKRRTFAIYREK